MKNGEDAVQTLGRDGVLETRVSFAHGDGDGDGDGTERAERTGTETETTTFPGMIDRRLSAVRHDVARALREGSQQRRVALRQKRFGGDDGDESGAALVTSTEISRRRRRNDAGSGSVRRGRLVKPYQ